MLPEVVCLNFESGPKWESVRWGFQSPKKFISDTGHLSFPSLLCFYFPHKRATHILKNKKFCLGNSRSSISCETWSQVPTPKTFSLLWLKRLGKKNVTQIFSFSIGIRMFSMYYSPLWAMKYVLPSSINKLISKITTMYFFPLYKYL